MAVPNYRTIFVRISASSLIGTKAIVVAGAPYNMYANIWYLMNDILTTAKAPEKLTGCGRETQKGFFECTTALAIEVCPAVIPRFHVV
jgi:hypothetical protein